MQRHDGAVSFHSIPFHSTGALTIGNHGVLVVFVQLLLYRVQILSFQQPQKGKDQYRKDGRLHKLINDSLDGRSRRPWLFSRWDGTVQKLIIKVIPRL